MKTKIGYQKVKKARKEKKETKIKMEYHKVMIETNVSNQNKF